MKRNSAGPKMSPEEMAGRVVRSTISDPADRRAAVRKATSKVKARAAIDFVRSVRR